MTPASFPIDTPLAPEAAACLEALSGQALPTFGPRLGLRSPGLELDYCSDRAVPLDFVRENGVPLIGLPRTLAGAWLALFEPAFWPCRLSALELALPPGPVVEARLPAKQSFVTAVALTTPALYAPYIGGLPAEVRLELALEPGVPGLAIEASARLVAAAPSVGNSPQLNRQLARASEVASEFWQIFATTARPWFAACGIRRLVLRGQVRDLAQQPPPESINLGDRSTVA